MKEQEKTSDKNDIADMVLNLVDTTGEHVFLTGKAGTGKTTLLRKIIEHTHKKTVVVAPTGVAAINAGGMTIHSLFQFPPGMFIPSQSGGLAHQNIFNKSNLARSIFLNSAKKKLINTMELLIIDEVSMLRADLLDAIDTMLRSVRQRYKEPMGGVQVLYIGDLWQLPPIVKDDEWHILSSYYNSPFFFDAQVIKERMPAIIELEKIYRQQDQNFIHLLNNLRNNEMHKDDFYELNKRYDPQYNNLEEDNIIILTSHNFKAQKINQSKLASLDAEPVIIQAALKGDFPSHNLPNEQELVLKMGTQVMFLKNDIKEPKRYFNGKIGIISLLKTNRDGEVEIEVTFENGDTIDVEKESWNNIKFEYNHDTDSIKEVILGSFNQFPIKPAWAITIHKSQGLTFEKVAIDAGHAFAPGQVYVALSRCTNLDGIVLLSEITQEAVATDERIQLFSKNKKTLDELALLLESKRKDYESEKIIDKLSLIRIKSEMYGFADIIKGKKPNNDLGLENFITETHKSLMAILLVAEKFKPQLAKLITDNDIITLSERSLKAATYFTNQLLTDVLKPMIVMQTTLKNSKKVSVILKKLQNISQNVQTEIARLQSQQYLGKILYQTDIDMVAWLTEAFSIEISKSTLKEINKTTLETTLELYLINQDIDLIASERGLAISTIWGHLEKLIAQEKIEVTKVLKATVYAEICEAINKNKPIAGITDIVNALNGKYDFSMVRCALSGIKLETARLSHVPK